MQKTKFNTKVKKINDKIASNSSEVLTYNKRLNQAKYRIIIYKDMPLISEVKII